MERVSFVSKVSSVMKATSDDASQIPGYLYPEIAKISLESAGTCETLLDFLVDRLDRNSYHVKLKVLKLMKYVVQNGNPNFAMGLRKCSRGLKEATVYGGPPDPLHGNIPYVLVRKAAKELSEIVFDAESEPRQADHGQLPVLKSTGGMGTSSTGRGMEGFGNSITKPDKTLGDAIRSGLTKLAEKIADPGPSAVSPLSVTQSCGEYKAAITSHVAVSQHGTKSSVTSKIRPGPRKHIPGRAGGGWDDDDVESEGHTGVALSSGSHSDGSQATSDRYESSSSTEDWSTEENFVSEVTNRPESFLLTRTDISQFLKRCPMVNCEKMVEILSRTLVGQSDKITVKCLQCIEGLLRSDLVSLEYIARTCRDSLLSAHRSPNGDVASKARKVIRILEKLSSHPRILPLHSWENSTASQAGENEAFPSTDQKQDGTCICVNQAADRLEDNAETQDTDRIQPVDDPSMYDTDRIEPSDDPSMHDTDRIEPSDDPSTYDTDRIEPSDDPSMYDTDRIEPSDGPSLYVPAFSGPALSMEAVLGEGTSDVFMSELSDTVISESSDTVLSKSSDTFSSEAAKALSNRNDEKAIDTDYYS